MEASPIAPETPAGQIIGHLQRHGEATVRELEEVLGVSTTAVREHLLHLEARGLVQSRSVRHGPGRPHRVYCLSPLGQRAVPSSYDRLAALLLREIASRAGPEALESLLGAVGERLAEEYRGAVAGGDLRQRLDQLHAALAARGIPSEVAPDGAGLQVFACPYLDVAREHAAVCAMERQMLEHVLGEPLRLDSAIREGQRSCRFVVHGYEA